MAVTIVTLRAVLAAMESLASERMILKPFGLTVRLYIYDFFLLLLSLLMLSTRTPPFYLSFLSVVGVLTTSPDRVFDLPALLHKYDSMKCYRR